MLQLTTQYNTNQEPHFWMLNTQIQNLEQSYQTASTLEIDQDSGMSMPQIIKDAQDTISKLIITIQERCNEEIDSLKNQLQKVKDEKENLIRLVEKLKEPMVDSSSQPALATIVSGSIEDELQMKNQKLQEALVTQKYYYKKQFEKFEQAIIELKGQTDFYQKKLQESEQALIEKSKQAKLCQQKLKECQKALQKSKKRFSKLSDCAKKFINSCGNKNIKI